MTCAQFSHNALQREDWRVRLKDLQIVNGGQTAHTARRVADEAGQRVAAAAEHARLPRLHGSRFVAMMVGRYLLSDLGIELGQLDHRSFARARKRLEANADTYVGRAEEQIGDALSTLFNGRERTLRRLSATFRRADLVDMLITQTPA